MDSIYFTEQEMMDFLNKRGWKLHEQEKSIQQHIHGSMFLYSKRTEWMAEKDADSYTLQEAFRKELKRKILYE